MMSRSSGGPAVARYTRPATAPDWMVLSVALATMVAWGGTSVATKMAVNEIEPFAQAAARLVCAGLFIVPVFLFGWAGSAPSGAARGRWTWLIAGMAATNFLLWPALMAVGIARTSALHAALIFALLPIYTGLIASALDRVWPPGRWWIGSGVAAVGAVVLVTSGEGTGTGALAGDAILLAGAFLAALGYLLGARASAAFGGWRATARAVAVGGIVAVPVLLWQGAAVDWAALSLRSWGALVYLALVSSILGYAGWYWALGHGGVWRTSMLQFLLPISGAIGAWWFLGETPSSAIGLAAALILFGVWCARRV